MRHIDEYITEAYSLAEAKKYLFSCLDKTDDYNFEVTLETCPLLAEYYCLSELSLSREFKNHPEYIYLALIVVNEEDQYSGYGTGFMEDLCEWADSRGKIITLTPDDDFGASSVSRLVKFYKRFGFVENKGKNTDFTHKQYMHRKPNVTEAVARRTTGKYGITVTDIIDYPAPTYSELLEWVKDNRIRTVDIGDYDWRDIRKNMGNGVALLCHNSIYKEIKEIILCPVEDNGNAYGFRFTLDGNMDEAILYEKTARSISGRNKTTQQLIGYVNDLKREGNFITEAVARRTTGKYDFHLSVDTKKNDFESFVMGTPLKIEELVATPVSIQDVDENSFGTGKCYVNRSKARNHTEYILCPEGKNFRYTVLFDNDDMVQALRTDKYGSAVRTDFRTDKATVLKEIEDYYN
jgi:GNAT superfamily N-acetyltransferase